MKGNNICEYYDVCPMKKFYEEGKLDEKWIKNYCFNNGERCKRKEMADKGIPHSDNILPNGKIDPSLEE